MDSLISSYTADIIKYMSGKNVSGKNIQTSDGKIGYITSTGIAKQYTSVNSLRNTNGCTTSLERIDTAWGDLGYPVGSLMVDGQSCGNETKYIRSNAPSIFFDWVYYKTEHPEFNFISESDALAHWENSGKALGYAPNKNMMQDIANMGKIGYVDINTKLHVVPQTAYKYSGVYKTYDNTVVTGINMVDCGTPIPPVKYGDQIYIKLNTLFGNTESFNILSFGAKKTAFFLRPPPGSDSLTGTPIKYGDEIVIAESSSNTKTKDCGWYGCKVLTVTPGPQSFLTNGPGGSQIEIKLKLMPPIGSIYTVGTPIKFLGPFAFVINRTNNDTLNMREYLYTRPTRSPDDNITSSIRKSKNGRYTLSIDSATVKVYDNTMSEVLWEPYKGGLNGGNSSLFLSTDGNLLMFNSTGNLIWFSNSANKGAAPYKLILQNDGHLCIYDSVNRFIWGSGAYRTDEKLPNILNPIVGNTFQYNSNFYVNFHTPTSTNSINNTFSFQDIKTSTYDTKCKPNVIQDECNRDPTCTGYIHLDEENTWQKIPFDSNKNMFTVTNKNPKIFMKEATVDMKDASCKAGTPSFVSADMYANYPLDYNFIMHGDQCSLVDNEILVKKREKYDTDNVAYVRKNNELVAKYPDLPAYTKENNNLNKQISDKSKEYTKVHKDIEKKKSKFSSTYDQQQEDLMVLENSNKANSLLWGISSLVIIAIVVVMRNRS